MSRILLTWIYCPADGTVSSEKRETMMQTEDKTYNGWRNYATWRVNLEILADYADAYEDEIGQYADVGRLADVLDEYVDEVLTAQADEGLVVDYARSFVSDVDFYEIAEHMIDDWKSNNPDADENGDDE